MEDLMPLAVLTLDINFLFPPLRQLYMYNHVT